MLSWLDGNDCNEPQSNRLPTRRITGTTEILWQKVTREWELMLQLIIDGVGLMDILAVNWDAPVSLQLVSRRLLIQRSRVLINIVRNMGNERLLIVCIFKIFISHVHLPNFLVHHKIIILLNTRNNLNRITWLLQATIMFHESSLPCLVDIISSSFCSPGLR